MKRYVKGPIRARSPFLSRVWVFSGPDGNLATVRRSVKDRSSDISLPDGTEWRIEPGGWGRLILKEGEMTIGEATRESLSGRSWQVSGQTYGYELGVDSMIRRRWSLGPSGSPIATLHGGTVSFNTMRIETGLPVPLEALMLSWHPIVRAWEAASTGRGR